MWWSGRVVGAVAVVALLGATGVGPASGARPVEPVFLPPGALLPDVIEEVPSHLTIQNTQQREWLRFTTVHINIGDGNLQIRGGGQIEPCVIDGIAYDQCTVAKQELLDVDGNIVASVPVGAALFHPEHNHWHQGSVAEFAIRETIDGPAVSEGVKVTFCFVDVEFIGKTGSMKKAQPRTYWECNGDLQGLASGWADSYHQSTPLQELEITGLAEGEYYLTHLADPDNHWVESDKTNNFTWVKFFLDRENGANPKVTVLDHSPCVPDVICGFGGNP